MTTERIPTIPDNLVQAAAAELTTPECLWHDTCTGACEAAQAHARAVINAVRPVLLAELDRLHSWDGLMSLLDEHWPEDLHPTLDDDNQRDPGPRIVSLLRRVDRLRKELAESTTLAEEHRQRSRHLLYDVQALQLERERLEDELSRLRAENTTQAERLDAVLELHRPVDHRGVQVCNDCTPLDVLMQTMSGRGRRGVEHPCPTRRALGLVQDREGQADA